MDRSFVTERKPRRRTGINVFKGSVVMERCRQLADMALELFPNRRISNEDLEYFIMRYVGADKETLRAYMGYRGRVARSKRSGEGYIIGTPRKGYLETFGFMHRNNHFTWLIHAQVKLPTADSGLLTNEGLGSKEEISLSPILQGKECEKTVLEVVSPTNKDTIESNNNNNNYRERDKSAPKIMPSNIPSMHGKTPNGMQEAWKEETGKILNAKSMASEPDRAKVAWHSRKESVGHG